jgi:DNA-binding transcriptional LysR family regulator
VDILNAMRIFIALAESGSFTAAAEKLDTSTVNISRTLNGLEKRLQTRLIHRTTRRMALTEAGQRYLRRCVRITDDIIEAEAEATAAHAHPSGQLKMHTMTGIGLHLIIDAISSYRKIHPNVSFNLTLANRVPDMLEDGYDISIVVASELPDSGFVSQRLGGTYSIVCASPDYVREFGVARKPGDLRSHTCLRLISAVVQMERWVFDGPDGQEVISIGSSPFQVNSADAIIAAISSGIGIGVLPIYAASKGIKEGSLIQMLPDYHLEDLNIYAIYPSRQYLDAKVRTWVDHLRETLPSVLAGQDAALRANAP